VKNIEMRIVAKKSAAGNVIWSIWLQTRLFEPKLCTKDEATGQYSFAPGWGDWGNTDCLDSFVSAAGSQAEVEMELAKWSQLYDLPATSLFIGLPEQENFFDAVRNDPEMSQENKDYWLLMEAETMAAANKAN